MSKHTPLLGALIAIQHIKADVVTCFAFGFEEEAALASVFALALAFLALRSAVLEEELDVEVARGSSA